MLLDRGEYATFNQIKEAGGTEKGEKSHLVVFWKMLHVEDKDTEREKSFYYAIIEYSKSEHRLKAFRLSA